MRFSSVSSKITRLFCHIPKPLSQSSWVGGAERVTSLGKDWHRPCLKCEKCNKTLSAGSHAEDLDVVELKATPSNRQPFALCTAALSHVALCSRLPARYYGNQRKQAPTDSPFVCLSDWPPVTLS
ncbi:hypothetical protein CCH79_00007996 [Gambusia affinis]|uniref:LIM zinc-binding domain-containing protein n=1 Tax=Gambusia affinis TaxID=33528 RepID=A0A315W259_GAMAF|nr:hypothetical protein CCH79_00007996 [Gambusia affinis]